MTEEKLLIKRTLEGDQESFEKIINLYKNYIFAIILNFIKDYEEVENVAQEVFLQVYLSLPAYKDDNFKAWISRITTNKAIDSIRSKRRKFQENPMEEEGQIEVLKLSDEKDDPLELLIEKEDSQELKQVLASLPQIYRDIIFKFYFEEKTYKEIAEEEDLSVKTIESRLYRGRNMLKEKWRERL